MHTQDIIRSLGATQLRQSFSISGRPHDNAVAETFLAMFKKRCIARKYLGTELLQKRGGIFSLKDTRVLGPPQRVQKDSSAEPQVFQGTFKLWRDANSP